MWFFVDKINLISSSSFVAVVTQTHHLLWVLNELDNNKTYKKDQINRYALKKLMEDFIANNRNHSMKEFKKILQEEFKLALEKEEKTDKEIIKRFKNLLKHYRKNKQDAFAYLR